MNPWYDFHNDVVYAHLQLSGLQAKPRESVKAVKTKDFPLGSSA